MQPFANGVFRGVIMAMRSENKGRGVANTMTVQMTLLIIVAAVPIALATKYVR